MLFGRKPGEGAKAGSQSRWDGLDTTVWHNRNSWPLLFSPFTVFHLDCFDFYETWKPLQHARAFLKMSPKVKTTSQGTLTEYTVMNCITYGLFLFWSEKSKILMKNDLNIFSFCCQHGSKHLYFSFNSWILHACLHVAVFLPKGIAS